MSDKGKEGWGSHEPFYILLNDYRVANIVITNHAKNRYLDRISEAGSDEGEIAAWLWQCLKQKRIKPYPNSEQNAYLIDDDLVMAAEFNELEGVSNLSGQPLYNLIIVSFLGKISSNPKLRDLKTYYSWLRHARRMKLIKKKRKRR
ncbi:hypothetical protein PaeBR_16285 [Paenibacillus sp. BR2-3]|uniref:hypothetical protein n=1 Tax=Paenibacillus sp. BR2-3 TaxID=3048494 RepID=UPI0039776DBA